MRSDDATTLLLHASRSVWRLLRINPQGSNAVANGLVEVMQLTVFFWTRQERNVAISTGQMSFDNHFLSILCEPPTLEFIFREHSCERSRFSGGRNIVMNLIQDSLRASCGLRGRECHDPVR
jgi:hypothetical protein